MILTSFSESQRSLHEQSSRAHKIISDIGVLCSLIQMMLMVNNYLLENKYSVFMQVSVIVFDMVS